MAQVAGIRYTKDAGGFNRYVRIDLKRYGDNELLEDLLDSLEVEARKGESAMPFEDFVKEENKRRGIAEDSLDSLEAEARKGEPTVPLREFMEEQNRKRGIVISV
ncbi:MAG: hypothetical protein LBK22_10265 [Tannerella sp.]|nr:hypothetical protein [Tannerella sp.]